MAKKVLKKKPKTTPSMAITKKFKVAKKKLGDVEKKLKKFVKENPKKSIAIAVALAAAIAAASFVAVKKLKKKK